MAESRYSSKGLVLNKRKDLDVAWTLMSLQKSIVPVMSLQKSIVPVIGNLIMCFSLIRWFKSSKFITLHFLWLTYKNIASLIKVSDWQLISLSKTEREL